MDVNILKVFANELAAYNISLQKYKDSFVMSSADYDSAKDVNEEIMDVSSQRAATTTPREPTARRTPAQSSPLSSLRSKTNPVEATSQRVRFFQHLPQLLPLSPVLSQGRSQQQRDVVQQQTVSTEPCTGFRTKSSQSCNKKALIQPIERNNSTDENNSPDHNLSRGLNVSRELN